MEWNILHCFNYVNWLQRENHQQKITRRTYKFKRCSSIIFINWKYWNVLYEKDRHRVIQNILKMWIWEWKYYAQAHTDSNAKWYWVNGNWLKWTTSWGRTHIPSISCFLLPPPCLPPVSMLPQLPSYPASCRLLPSPPSAHLPPVKQCDLTPSYSLSSASKSLLGAQHLAPLMSHADRLQVPPRRASLQGHLCSRLAFLIRHVCPSLNQGSPRTEVASFILPPPPHYHHHAPPTLGTR